MKGRFRTASMKGRFRAASLKGRFRTASMGQVQGSINEGQVQNSISGGRFRAASVRAGGRFRIAGQATASDDRRASSTAMLYCSMPVDDTLTPLECPTAVVKCKHHSTPHTTTVTKYIFSILHTPDTRAPQ